MKKAIKIFILGLFLMSFDLAVNAQSTCTDPLDFSCDSGCTDPSGNCDLPLDNNVIFLGIAGLTIGAFMLRKKLNTVSFQA